MTTKRSPACSIERFRRIPDRGETLAMSGLVIEVIAATDRAIEAVRITKRKKRRSHPPRAAPTLRDGSAPSAPDPNATDSAP